MGFSSQSLETARNSFFLKVVLKIEDEAEIENEPGWGFSPWKDMRKLISKDGRAGWPR